MTTAAILTTLHITAALAGVCAFTLLAVIVIELTGSRRNRSRR